MDKLQKIMIPISAAGALISFIIASLNRNSGEKIIRTGLEKNWPVINNFLIWLLMAFFLIILAYLILTVWYPDEGFHVYEAYKNWRKRKKDEML